MAIPNSLNGGSTKWSGLRVILLARQSDNGEGDDSTRAQIELLIAACEQQGMSVVGQVVLEGVTGSVPGKHHDLNQLLDRKRQHDDFDVLAVQR